LNLLKFHVLHGPIFVSSAVYRVRLYVHVGGRP